MASKVSTSICMSAFFFLLLLFFFFFSLSHAAGRPGPSSSLLNPSKIQHRVLEVAKVNEDQESCEGDAEDECLMRRTLAAHLDYIYTQKHKP